MHHQSDRYTEGYREEIVSQEETGGNGRMLQLPVAMFAARTEGIYHISFYILHFTFEKAPSLLSDDVKSPIKNDTW